MTYEKKQKASQKKIGEAMHEIKVGELHSENIYQYVNHINLLDNYETFCITKVLTNVLKILVSNNSKDYF